MDLEFDSHQLKAMLDAAARGGAVEVRALAFRLNRPYEDVEQVVERHKRQEGGMTSTRRLSGYLEILQSMIETADMVYRGEPTDKNAKATATLISTAQAVLDDIEGRRDMRIVLEDFAITILQPMIDAFVKKLAKNVDEVIRPIEDLARTNRIDEPAKQQLIQSMKNVVTMFGVLTKQHYVMSVEQAAQLLGVDEVSSLLEEKPQQRQLPQRTVDVTEDQ